MNTPLRAFISTTSASLVPAILVTAIFSAAEGGLNRWSITTFCFTWFVSAAHIILIGFPIFLLLYRKGLLGWRSMSCAGFTIGFIPIAVFVWPYSTSTGWSSSGKWYGTHVDFVVNGVPTIYWWLDYILTNCYFGLFGAISALAFWQMWRKLEQLKNHKMRVDTFQ
jgi:hypothetical protein